MTPHPEKIDVPERITALANAAGNAQVWAYRQSGCVWFKIKFGAACWSPPFNADEAAKYLKDAGPKRPRMRRASYRDGVEWIALNDDPIDREPTAIRDYMSTRLLACLFDVPQEQVAADIVKRREREQADEDKRSEANARARAEEEDE